MIFKYVENYLQYYKNMSKWVERVGEGSSWIFYMLFYCVISNMFLIYEGGLMIKLFRILI